MSEFYKSTCELTLKYRDSKEVVIRKAVITLIPNMATFDSEAFETHYLQRSMSYLLQSLGKPTDRDIGESTDTRRDADGQRTSPSVIWLSSCRPRCGRSSTMLSRSSRIILNREGRSTPFDPR